MSSPFGSHLLLWRLLSGSALTPSPPLCPLSRALKILPEVELQGVLGGSVVIECPLQGETQVRMYLCRQMANPKMCTTVVSSHFVKEGYKHRVTMMPCSDRNLFLVKLMGLTESDSGVYACGLGRHTDQGKTLKVTLSVHNVEYEPFWEEDPMAEPQDWFHKALPQMPGWLQMAAHDRPSDFISRDAAAQRTEAPLALRSTAPLRTAHRSQTPRASSAAASTPPTTLPSSAASKTSAQEGAIGPQEATYKHHTWLHRQRASSSGSAAGREDLGFHILIPSALGLLLLALLGLVLRRAVQRRRALSRRIRRLAVRMRALEASGRPGSRQPRPGQRPRSQNNVYSACPRRAPESAAGPGDAPAPEAGPSAPPAPPQVPDTPWLPAPSLKTSCEYVAICHQPAARRTGTDSDDYINIPSLTSLLHCPLEPRSWRP